MKTKSSSFVKSLKNRFVAVLMLVTLLIVALPVATASADTIGYFQPSTAVINGRSAWLNPTNAFNSDNVYTTTAAKKKQLKLGDFNISPIQGNSTINGLEVTVEGYQNGGRQVKVELSWDGGKTWTTYKPQTSLGTTADSLNILGSSTNTWGRTWAASEFTNAKFKVRLTSMMTGSGTLYIDQVQVKIYYSPTDTTLVVQKAQANYGETEVTLSATLTQTVGGAPLAGRTIYFTLNGTSAGSAVTDGSGVATLQASIAGLNAGLYQDAVYAEFLGEPSLQATYGIADLDIHGDLVIVQPQAAYKNYGDTDPALLFDVVYGTLTPADFTGALTRDPGEDVGDYLITQGTLTAPLGYVLQVLQTEFLTINPITITVSTLNYTKAASDPVYSDFAPIYTGFAFSDDESVFLTPATCSVDPALQIQVGIYPIVCSGATALNYVFDYTTAGTLTVNADAEPVLRIVSIAGKDGWVRESSETSGQGSLVNTTASLRVGDDALNREYRSIVFFKGIVLPSGATITKVTLQLTSNGKVGTNPFTTHGNLKVDLSIPSFGKPALLKTDFQVAPSLKAVGRVQRYSPSSNVYVAELTPAALAYLNSYNQDPAHLNGLAKLQLRLHFKLDDNNDFGADYFKFYSGDSTVVATQPVLVIEYALP